MSKIELLSPAGSPMGVRAAVQSGADAVYMGFGTFNARRGAQNFSREEMAEAIAYCRARGVKTNITLNILVSDREMTQALADARFLYEAGADALIVQDLGLARLLRCHAPDFALHASTQMTIHSLSGALAAKELGFSRVVLSRELPREQIEFITKNARVETEIFVHGALCMCYSGQCYLSALIGQRSGNRGLCAQPCRLPYSGGYPLSLKDLALAGHVAEIADMGVSSLKIEGRMKRPEYTAIVTGIYADLLRERRTPTAQERDTLRRVFSRAGFTDGYYMSQKGDDMFGVKTDVPLGEVKELYAEAAHRFEEGRETPRVPVCLRFSAQESGLALSASDGMHTVEVTDGTPVEQAEHQPTTGEMVQKCLTKTGGTPFLVRETELSLSPGLRVPAARINALRRQSLEKLIALRAAPPKTDWQDAEEKTDKTSGHFCGWTAAVRTREQAQALSGLSLDTIYLPLELCAGEDCPPNVTARLPRIYFDNEREQIEKLLACAWENGVRAVLAGNLGQIAPAQKMGFAVQGDFGLNAFNSGALRTLAGCGVCRQTVSFEARLAQVRDMDKPLPCELIVYGRLPLMIFENCAIRRAHGGECRCKQKQTALRDRRGQEFPLLPEFGCRNTLYNSRPLFLREDWSKTGVSYGRMEFTTESPEQCAQIADELLHGRPLSGEYTNGLYLRGVE